MATELTTASASSTVGSRNDAEFHPLDWWAGLDDGIAHTEPSRHTPPIPAFVRLSRLVDPDQVSAARGLEVSAARGLEVSAARGLEVSAARGLEPETAFDPPVEGPVEPEPATTRYERATPQRWADSAGRPLYRIGLLAIAAAIVVAVATFGPGDDDVSTVESPVTMIDPDAGSDNHGDGTADADEQTRRVLETLIRQSAGDAAADLSIVGTASGDHTEVRWTATIRNAGPEPVEGPITVVHTIGADFELDSVAGSGWNCEHRRTAGTITCELDEGLGSGQRRRLGLVTSLAGVEPGTKIPGTMSVVAGTTDPDLDNNTVNLMAATSPADDAGGSRSPSAGAAGQTDAEADAETSAGSLDVSGADQARTAGMEELPHTGSGLATVLGVAGVGLCLAGRRLITWSARAQTRLLLVTADLD